MDAHDEFWHGSHLPLPRLMPGRDGGIHLGTRSQAEMRSGAFLHRVEFRPRKGAISTSRDSGDGWAAKIRTHRAKGSDAIRYLNRYEGLGAEAADRIASRMLDRLSDSRFAKAVPEAAHSWIALHETDVRVLEIVPGRGRACLYHACSPELAEKILLDGMSASHVITASIGAAQMMECRGGDHSVILEIRLPARSIEILGDGLVRSWLELASSDMPHPLMMRQDVPAAAISVHARLDDAPEPEF